MKDLKTRLAVFMNSEEVADFILNNNFNLKEDWETALILDELVNAVYDEKLEEYQKQEPKAKEIFNQWEKDVSNYYGSTYEGLIKKESFSFFKENFLDFTKDAINNAKISILQTAIKNQMAYQM